MQFVEHSYNKPKSHRMGKICATNPTGTNTKIPAAILINESLLRIEELETIMKLSTQCDT